MNHAREEKNECKERECMNVSSERKERKECNESVRSV